MSESLECNLFFRIFKGIVWEIEIILLEAQMKGCISSAPLLITIPSIDSKIESFLHGVKEAW